MTSSITGIQLALPDTDGAYKKTRRLYNDTAGLDTSAGGVFVKLSGAGVTKAVEVPSTEAGADAYGIVFDAVPTNANADGSEDLYIDVYCGLQDKFIATVNTCSDASALLNGATVFIASTGNSLSLASAGLDIIGTIENGAQSVSAGSRVIFSLTPSTAIAGYDSGNTT